MTSPYQQALNSGYSEEEIKNYLSKKDPEFSQKYEKAIESGYNPNEVFEFYSQKQQPKEGIISGALRQGGRSAARVAETALGAPRAVGEFLEGLVPEKLLTKGAKKIGLEKPAKALLETTKKIAPYKLLPTSEDVKSGIKYIFGEKVEPKNAFEKKADELITDFTALALPLPGKELKILKPALVALGGNLTSSIIGKMGGTEKEKTLGKLGTFFISSLVKPGGAKKLGNQLYEEARTLRPANVRVDSPQLNTRLNQIERNLKKGGSETWKPKIQTKIEELRKNMAGNNIEVAELERFKPAVNNILSELYAEKNVSKTGIKSAQRYANQLAHIIDQSLGDYGKVNPKWEKIYRQANEVYGSIAQSNKVRNFLERNLGKVSPHLTASLFGLGHGPGGKTLTGLVAKGATGAAVLESGALLSRIYKSPTLRKYYMGVVQNAIKEDAVAMRENLNKLEAALSKEN